ncbi:uncharacterized protein LOC122617699 [Drosophila teissieri]|uniref:uncharacterized protein LOC122617699 n=1 Tax=Drosophila teissieri TaxID=7243 RepID=UPI001CBA393A|nr:uncharacterized protein LOC122617699 [Drosophila teissieri]
MDFQRSITDMPFEILDLIFETLNFLKFKVSLAQAHEKLAKAFAFHCRLKFRSLTVDGRLTLDSWEFLIRECGATIEEFVYGGCGRLGKSVALTAVAKHCPNLKSVRIQLYRSDRENLPVFLENVKSLLTSLKISQQDHFPATFLSEVSEMTQLKEFSFKGYMHENVHHLDKLIALEKLSIEDIKHYSKTPVDLMRICASLKKLRHLTIIKLQLLPYDEPHSTFWSDLEYLCFNYCEFSFELPDCPKLKYLNIEYPNCDIEGYVLKFILKNGKNLTELHERCSPPIDGNGFLDLLRGCPKLRCLYTPMEFIKLYAAYVAAMVEILKENGATPEDPLELVVCRRIKWKWFRRLHLRTPDAELIDLYEGTYM